MSGVRRLLRHLWRRITWRLFVSYLAVGLAAIGLLGLFVLVLAANYSRQHPGSSGYRLEVLQGVGMAALAAVVASAGASLFVSRRIVRPLRQMMDASGRIAAGQYHERVAVDDDFEITMLAESFNQMAVALEHTEELRRMLIADVTHELRTPLTSIKGYMEALLDGVIPPGNETFALVYAEADRLYHLVEDLQELSRIEAGAVPIDPRPVDLVPLLQGIAGRVRPQFEAKGVRLAVSSVRDVLNVLGDEDRLCQVFLNLLSNALRYTPPGGSVEVQGQPACDRVHVLVKDTGVGIAPEHLDHIFDRFYRVDKSRSRSQGGTGIGLTIAKHLAELHGGDITVSSEVGSGSTFTVSLPAAHAGC